MSTRRERNERRAERLRDWADGREQKSEAAHAASGDAVAGIPLGQPILVGHHSEKRHRKALQRSEDQFAAAMEHGKKAQDMRSRAANIDAATDRAIYDDDPDAVERLTAKIEALEAERDRRKAANATYRREHRAELKAMSAYDRGQAVPFPSYSLTNLTGNIGRLRKRLTQLQAPDPGRVLVTRYPGVCRECGKAIDRGEQARYFKRSRELACVSCEATS